MQGCRAWKASREAHTFLSHVAVRAARRAPLSSRSGLREQGAGSAKRSITDHCSPSGPARHFDHE
eukprot:3731884-Alexandrium_andersonii.AAC.1